MELSKKQLLFTLLCLSLLTLNACKQNSIEPTQWELTFSDEFNDTFINHNKWETELPWMQSNTPGINYYYSDSAFKINNGILHILAKRDTIMGKIVTGWNPLTFGTKQYFLTTGLLNSSYHFRQQYGYFEIRSKVPYGYGFLPAFWLLGYSGWPPEIDVYEIQGQHPSGLLVSNHFRDAKGIHRNVSKNIESADFSKDFHVFGIEWNPKYIIWYLDHNEVFRTETEIPQEPMYLVVNLALDGGSNHEHVNETTPMPATFDIDYIRAYKKVENN